MEELLADQEVTVHELYNANLPNVPGLASSLGTTDKEVVLAVLAQRPGLPRTTGGLAQPSPCIGPAPDLTSLSPEALEAQLAAVKGAQERVSQHLRSALQRRAASRCGPERSGSPGAVEVPAAFPFPEPIPLGPPARRPHRSSAQTSRASSRAGAWTSFSSRLGCDRSTSTTPGVPAVFPFPEPIPHEPPSRRPPQVRRPCAAATPAPILSEGRSIRPDLAAVAENKHRANGWISECVPKTWPVEQEKPVWVQLQLENVRARKMHARMCRNMPTMPFDLWLEMKREEEQDRDWPSSGAELRHRYISLGAARRAAFKLTSRQLAEAAGL